VVSVLLMLYFAASGIGMLAGGAFKLIGGAAQALGSVVQSQGAPDVSGSVEQMIQRLKDPKTAEQIAAATGMPASEVQAILGETAQRVENNRANPTQAAAEAKNGVARLMEKAKSSGALQQKAEEVKPEATRAAWMTFGALLLSLLAAVIGAMAGRRARKVRSGIPLGKYHRASKPDGAAWIELVVDAITEQLPSPLSWLQLARDLVFARVLYHEVGHHLHVTKRSLGRHGEATAEAWRRRLSRAHFRRHYWYVLPILSILGSAARKRRQRR
jgi:hypothetical protein